MKTARRSLRVDKTIVSYETIVMSRPISSESAYRAIADLTRRRIIDLLQTRPLSPNELNETLSVTGTVLSFHLRTLTSAGIISQRRKGKQRVYRLNRGALSSVAQWIRQQSELIG